MPVILHVDELEPGMRLFQAIYRDDQVMLPAGKVLEEWEINSLRRRFPDLTVRIGDPVLDDFVEFQDDSRDHEVACTVTQRIGGMMRVVREKLGNQTSLRAGDIADLQASIAAMIEYIRSNPVTAALIINSGHWSDYLQGHSANVFYISLLLGNAIRDYIFRERNRGAAPSSLATRYSMDLTPLALGCFFHDIGMVPLQSVYSQEEPLSPDQVAAIRAHPLRGAEMLPEKLDSVARMIVRTHHENFNGTGYPCGLPRNRLHIFSRVIRVADAYDAATSERVYKNGKTPARVLWEMSAGPTACCYDPIVVKMLLGLIQPFPIGARLRLHTGVYGVVVRHNRRQPFRPVIVIAFDEQGRRLRKAQLSRPINLAVQEEIRLISFGKEDLGFLNDGTLDDFGRPGPGSPAREAISSPRDLFAMVYP